MTVDDAIKICVNKQWTLRPMDSQYKIWVVGPEKNGMQEVLGQGPSFVDAVENALKQPTEKGEKPA